MVKIRIAKPKDQQRIADLLSHYALPEFAKKRAHAYTSFANTVIAENNNKIVGMIQWNVKENPQAGVIELEEAFVLEEYRNKGIGSQLIQKSLTSALEFFTKNKIIPRKAFLFVSKKNMGARQLYEKMGFHKVAELNDLLSNGETELFYCKDF
jgi:ribosomal protein S18 acetylase RimI-like enzyme